MQAQYLGACRAPPLWRTQGSEREGRQDHETGWHAVGREDTRVGVFA